MIHRKLGAWLGLIAGVALLGCAQEREPINRVQANVLDKSFFVGEDLAGPEDDPEFYWRAYVVDASASQSLVGVGSWAGVDRIRWEISEDLLVARKAYQIINGQDNKALPQRTPDGTVVAAYRIESHFDIRRGYNPQTGEELNIIEENSSDEPWQRRKFMRVDWSKNLVDNPMWGDMFLGKTFGELELQPLSYYVDDPNHPDAPHFEVKEGYFDITNRYYVSPETTSTGWADLPEIPTCALVGLYTGSASYDCNAQEATVRQSYWKVDPNHDFESLELTTAPEDIIGNPGGQGNSLTVGLLTPGQQGWDPGYGYPDKLYRRFAHILNIWKKSHLDVPCGSNVDENQDGTADACELAGATSRGSQCDVVVGKCTIPYRDRELKTVGYWLNVDAPADLQDPLDENGAPLSRGAFEDIIYSWNQLFAGAAGFAREVECRRTRDGDRETCHSTFFEDQKVMVSYGGWLADQPRDPATVLTLCHNPVRDYDVHDVCGKTGESARVGDLRKNFIFYWPWDSRAPWGGIANWNADPLTGEIIGGAAAIMGRSATFAAAMQRDALQVALGDLSVEDITDGTPSENYARLLRDGYRPEALTKKEIDRRVRSVDVNHLLETAAPAPLAGNNVADRYQSLVLRQSKSTQDVTQQHTAQLEFESLANKVRGSQMEAQLVDSHWLVGAMGMDPSTPLDEGVMNLSSPLRGMDPGRQNAWRDIVTTRLHARGVCYLENEAPAAGSVYIQGLAPYFRQKYGELDPLTRGERMYHDLWLESVKGIGIHEVGHSLGMFHNFSSSWDAASYQPQYWQLRTAEGTANASCQGQPRALGNDTCMGPRYLDPETDDERGFGDEPRPGISYFGNSSVMEYQLERFGETVGLGTFDAQFVKAAYGRVLETIDDDAHGGIGRDAQHAVASRMTSQLGEEDRIYRVLEPTAVFGSSPSAWPAHYTETARHLRLFDPQRDCRDATEDEKRVGEWRIVHGKICQPTPRDHAAWQDFLSDAPDMGFQQPTLAWHTRGGWQDGGDRVRWFYRTGQTHNSYLHCNTSDAGADPYEVTVNTVQHFDVTYPWSYFRRNNREYYYDGVPARTTDRYLERIRAFHWVVANSNAFYAGFGASAYDAIANLDDWHRPYLVAEVEMFNFLARAMLMPEPGEYARMDASVDQTRPIFDATDFASGFNPVRFNVEIIDGRYIGEDFASEPDAGGSWDYLSWMNHAGFYTEKFMAASALTDSRPTLFTIARENYLDGRNVKISFRNDMPEALDRLLGGILAEDWEAVSLSVPSGVDRPRPEMLDLTTTDSPPSRPSDNMVVFPNIGYRQQLAAAVNAALFSRLNTDMGLMNKMRVWIHGQVGEMDLPEAEQIRFRDPDSGYTYVARRYGMEQIDGKSVERGIGSRMLQHAASLMTAAYRVERKEGQIVTDEFGQPVLVLDDDGQPITVDPTKVAEFRRYVGLVDAIRQLGTMLGFGPLDTPTYE